MLSKALHLTPTVYKRRPVRILGPLAACLLGFLASACASLGEPKSVEPSPAVDPT